MGVLFYQTTRITIPSDPSAWRQGAKRSPLFQFTVSRGPRVLVQRVAVNIRCLFTTFTQKATETIPFAPQQRVTSWQKRCSQYVEDLTVTWMQVTSAPYPSSQWQLLLIGRQVGAAWRSCNKRDALSEVEEGTILFLARVQEVIGLTILSVFPCLAGAACVCQFVFRLLIALDISVLLRYGSIAVFIQNLCPLTSKTL
jgi:hypothetical protein